MNFVCLYMPDFLLQARLRGEPGALDQTIALLDGSPSCLRVVAVTRKAREAGIAPGMTKAQAAQLAGIRQRSLAQEDSAHAALLDCARACSPRVEDTAADTVVLDLEGLGKLLGPPSQIANRLQRQAEGLGLEIHLAFAANPDTAILAARGFHGITMIPPGEEAQKLGELPVSVLHPQPEILSALRRWGIYRLKELASLPALPLSERLGQTGIRLQELARGRHSRSLIISREREQFEEIWELENPAETLDELDFILSSLLTRLAERLRIRSLATQEIRLRLDLAEGMEPGPSLALEERKEDGSPSGIEGAYERSLHFPLPVCNAKLFFKLWRLRLESDLPRSPVIKVKIIAQPARPRALQAGLFAPLAPDPERLELTLARITSLVGSGNVGSPELVDTHRPRVFRMAGFNPAESSHLLSRMRESLDHRRGQETAAFQAAGDEAPSVMALRLFRPPLLACVELSSGCPLRLVSSHLRGKVVFAAGPWRMSGGWWEEDNWDREEWDIAIKTGKTTALYSIYHDRARDGWYVQGEYD